MFKQMLDVVLGLILIYFIISLASSSLSQLLMDTLEIRGKTLERYLHLIVGDKIIDLLALPQIKSLRPIRFRSWLGIFGASIEPKKVENIPVPILVDAFLDLMDLADKKNQKAEDLSKVIHKMPESEGKRAMWLWVNQGIVNLDDLRSKLNVYFSGLLEQSAATANANARSFVITLSIVIVLLLGTDSILLAKQFFITPELRAIADAQLNAVISQNCGSLDNLIKEVGALSVRIGWADTLRYLPIGADPLDWTQFIIYKIFGLAITVVFVSQGSGFWFDLLSKLK